MERKRAVHLARALPADGVRGIPRLWIENTDGVNFWVNVCNDLKTLGVIDGPVTINSASKGIAELLDQVISCACTLRHPIIPSISPRMRNGIRQLHLLFLLSRCHGESYICIWQMPAGASIRSGAKLLINIATSTTSCRAQGWSGYGQKVIHLHCRRNQERPLDFHKRT